MSTVVTVVGDVLNVEVISPSTIDVSLINENNLNVSLATEGERGPQGESYQESYESVSKNIRSWNYSFNYSSGQLVSINYQNGSSLITKTFNYDIDGQLVSIVLSGDTPSGISYTKTLNYTGSTLSSVSYS